ncbi:transcriptional regulator-domain-containing protein [Lophiotrema nucula]|uniref:Transcriptional regulator-domain-containing protein n=1 Tax=Lophiotrema nucula TaxID=690887 RepID=A0A6A5ZI66_9PLEO|nr:transcriptional regulator-domain-containing protein [Lophiotrema nucula]
MSSHFRRKIRPLHSFDSVIYSTCERPVAPARGLRWEQARCLSASAPWWSGHSKWATIKHDKGKNDAAKSKQRAILTQDISRCAKYGGPDPNMNPRLALAIATAKKNAVPKAGIEAAIARGQGLSASGAALESVTLEALIPPNVATVIDCQTDNKLRILADLRLLVKEAGGSVSTINFMFEKKGRIIFGKKEGVGADEVLEPALEAGVLDVIEDEQGRVVLFTEPAQTKTTAETLAKALELEIEESEVIWDPNEDTKVTLDEEEAAQHFNGFLDELQEVQGVQGVYTNWSKGAISDEIWAELRSKVAV